ncbi:MAG: carbohydrate-binding family 9-like protein [Candidatus Latescibacterota bacterium]
MVAYLVRGGTVEPEIAEPTTWVVEYHVPFALLATYFGAAAPRAGTAWRANFYKCGDHTSHPHWGSWAPVATPRPNFHQPDSFQPTRFA